MIQGFIGHKVIDGTVYVKFDDLIQALYVTAERSMDVAEATKNTVLTAQILGLIEVTKVLDERLDKIKQANGLAMHR